MPIQFSCPHCGAQTSVADQYAGQSGPCASCGQTVTIPGPAPGGMSSSSPPQKTSSSSTSIIVVLVSVIGVLVVCGGILVALLPAVQAAREAARRAQCVNNTKQIVLALHNYHDTNRTFPPAYTTDENGKPMHSWRALILPYIGGSGPWQDYDYDQPWDSPHNLSVAETIPEIYRCPSDDPTSTDTNYMVITGPGTLFEGTEAKKMRAMSKDGTSNTAIIVEVVNSGVHWTQPTDVDVESFVAGKVSPEENSLTEGESVAPSSHHPGVFIVGFADGSVHTMSEDIDPRVLRAITTIAGGEVINLD